jgi:hypothetical protein
MVVIFLTEAGRLFVTFNDGFVVCSITSFKTGTGTKVGGLAKPKPTTPPPSIPFQQRTSAPPSIPIQQRIQPPPPIPIHQTTLPPIIVPPVLPALFEEAPMPPRLIKNDIKRIPIIKSTQKTPGNIGTSSTKTEKATAYPVNTGTSSKNGIQTTVSPLVTEQRG